MPPLNLIILSYHKFVSEESEYPFSRTYKKFINDIETKVFDWVTIDDGLKSQIKACDILRKRNIRAKLFITTSLVGEPAYCTWSQLFNLSKYHDIECHSHQHKYLTDLTDEQVHWNIRMSCRAIQKNIGIKPRYFVPPYNTFDERIEGIVKDFNLQLVKNRDTVKNDTL